MSLLRSPEFPSRQKTRTGAGDPDDHRLLYSDPEQKPRLRFPERAAPFFDYENCFAGPII